VVARANIQPKPDKELACPNKRIDRRESTKRQHTVIKHCAESECFERKGIKKMA